MSVESTRAAVLRAAEDLRVTHGEALGALDSELKRIEQKSKTERSKVEATAKRDLAIAQTRASNNVMAAHSKIRNYVLSLMTSESSDALRVASVVDLGELLINAKRAGVNSQLDVPLIVPLIGAGNLTVVGGGERSASLVRNVQLEALRGTAAGQLSLISYDPLLANPLAPFAKLADAGDDLVRTIQAPKDLDGLIDQLTATIARVGNLLMGGPGGLVDHRENTGKQLERFHLVSLHNYPLGVTEQQHSRILSLARVAARHGIAFLFQIPEPKALPGWLDLKDLKTLGDSLDVTSSRVIWARRPDLNAALPDVAPTEVVAAVESVVAAAEQASKTELRSLLAAHDWAETSIDGLTVPLAFSQAGPIEIAFGDDLPHGLITGSSGSGKSNLIKLLIYGLSSRYSPDELALFLLDMKEGVTLAPMAPTAESPTYLPQARVIGLQADQEYGLSLLQEVERIYKRRMAEMSPFDNIKAFRKQHPEARMPRVIIVIDEFQLLLADDANRIGREAAAKLLSLVKLVRAAGIHIVIATQEIGSIGALAGVRDGLLAQIKLRIALQNTPRGSEQTLEGGNTAAAQLRFKGEVVINKELGAKDANEIGRTPFADETTLTDLRVRWYERRPEDLTPAAVFNGKPPAELLVDTDEVLKARGLAAEGSVPRVILGRPVAVSQAPLAFSFDSIPGRNLAIIGSSSDGSDEDYLDDAEPSHLALGPLIACGLSLAAQHAPGKADFVILDLLSERDRAKGRVPEWLEALRKLGHAPTLIVQNEVKEWITSTAKSLSERSSAASPTYVFGLGFERVPPIMEREGGPGTVAPVKQLQSIWQHGPTAGLHSIFWWSHGPTYLAHIEKKMESFFTGTLVLFGAEEVAQRVNDLATKWEGAENRGLFRDSSGSQGRRKLIPYRPLSKDELTSFITRVTT